MRVTAMSDWPHQYIDRPTSAVREETLFGDRLVRMLYGSARENAPLLFKALVSPRASDILGRFAFDSALGARAAGARAFAREAGIDLSECLAPPDWHTTYRRVFERRIRYWERRPMPEDPRAVVSCADARLLPGSFAQGSRLFLKEKFFSLAELLGATKTRWVDAFKNGDHAVFRLTAEKYHYNHSPVAGRVLDIYAIDGQCHSCNPGALVAEANLYSKNRRTVTVLDTDVPGGTGAGLVAMVEVTALLIGRIRQCASETRYDAPREVVPGMFLRKGCPKSLYRPGSSTDVLLFEPGRVVFDRDIVENSRRLDAQSRFSMVFGRPAVETEVRVREQIGMALPPPGEPGAKAPLA
jgi:phosphatidylserine decarboxylase